MPSRRTRKRPRKRQIRGLDENLSSIHLDNIDDPSEIGDLSGDLSVGSHGPLEPILAAPEEEASSDHTEADETEECDVLTPIAQKETQNVTRWKTFVMSLLLINACLVTIATFEFMRRGEEEEFRVAFHTAARTVSDASHYHAHALVDTMNTFGETVTSFAVETDVQWPLISVPHFERRASLIRHASFLNLFGLVPIVQPGDREDWEKYSQYKQTWIQDSYDVQATMPERSKTHIHKENSQDQHELDDDPIRYQHTTSIPPHIHTMDNHTIPVDYNHITTSHAPLWQLSPPPPPDFVQVINTDLLSGPFVQALARAMFFSNFMALSEALYFELYKDPWFFEGDGEDFKLHENATYTHNSTTSSSTPESVFVFPIYDSFDEDSRSITAFALGLLPWEKYFSDLLPDEIIGVLGVVQNSCGQVMSFAIDGHNATFLAAEDLHDPSFDTLVVETTFSEFQSLQEHSLSQGQCHYKMRIYPTMDFRKAHTSSRPEYFALGLALLFLFTAVVFLIFVYYGNHRQRKVMAIAVGTSAIVASMFPSTVRERILKDAEEEAIRKLEGGKQVRGKRATTLTAGTERMTDISSALLSIDESDILPNKPKSRPIADVFPDVTIMFGDIVGFTAWSSVREPQQVFELLETIYHAFDAIAKRRRVYKVETIGDCYVACAGLPTPREDHALLMARFVRECFSALEMLTKQLERSLGPDTGELTMRFGLHSGPCTAGVLRGDRARYQLFGDAVNVAARMESTSEPGHIQISQDTAELLAAAKKSCWFIPRDNKIQAKGKGEVQTYWLHPKRDEHELRSEHASSDTASSTQHWLEVPDNVFGSQGAGNDTLRARLSEQNQRLAEWNSNQLLKLLNQVVKQRNAKLVVCPATEYEGEAAMENAHIRWTADGTSIVDEVKDAIRMPPFNPAFFPKGMDNSMSELSDVAIQQLHDYVSIICSMYNKDNLFHNYQHASHVTMHVGKLLSQIVTPPRNNKSAEATSDECEAAELYDKSLGIAADPMAQFGVAFACLIQDVDHPGVTNAQLVREGSRMARTYDYVSISEQNSFSVAWDLLMDPMFSELRTTIYTNREEFDHFREVLVNAVMATDLYNEEANAKRNKRWEKAFYVESTKAEVEDVTTETSSSSCSTNNCKYKSKLDRKATLVIECIMQASEISNLMQHWHVYQKWNDRQFKERCRAYQQDRESQNPAVTWYQGQLDLFDSIGIPLAKKLKEAGVFCSFSDDYLSHAKKNREEWFRKGTTIVQSMEKNFAEKHKDKPPRTPSRTEFQVEADDVSSEPRAPGFVGTRRSRSEDSIFPNWDEPQRGGMRRHKSMDGAPRAPQRSTNDVGSEPPSHGFVGRRRSRSDDSIFPNWDEGGGMCPRKSVDGAPRAPRRSTNDILDPSIAVAEMFSQLPDFRRSRSDVSPQHPRRTNDSVSVDFEEPSRAVQAMFDALPENAPRTPRRTRDSVNMTAIAKQVAANTLGTSLNELMSTSLNNQSVDAPTLDKATPDVSPKTPLRRGSKVSAQAFSNAPPGCFYRHTDGTSSPDQDESVNTENDESSALDRDHSIVSDCDSEHDESTLLRLDHSDASESDESTLLTMGNLWNPAQQRDWSSHADESTSFAKEQQSVGPIKRSV